MNRKDLNLERFNVSLNPNMYELYGYDAWIFDLDGTLVDSHQQIQFLLASSIHRHLGYEPDHETLESLIGLSLDQILVSLAIPENSRAKIKATFREDLVEEVKLGNKLFDGVFEFLCTLKRDSIKVGIATNKSDAIAKLVVENSQMQGLVDSIVGSATLPPKPAPDILQRCVRELGGTKHLMIGDRKEDLFAAQSAELDFIGITSVPKLKNLFLENGAKLVLNAFSELSKLPKFSD